jgi:type II secretory pathway pseudopilin PulG
MKLKANLQPKLRMMISAFLCTSLAFANPQPLASDEMAIDHALRVNWIKTHLLLALDGYNSARDAYTSRGPDAFIEEMPELTKDDQSFLKEKLSSLRALPKISLEGENVLVASKSVRATVVSLENNVTLAVNGSTIVMPTIGSIRTTYPEMREALNQKTALLDFNFSSYLVSEAHADTTIVVLGIVAILAAAFLGGKSYSHYKDEKASDEKALLMENATNEQLGQYRRAHGQQPDGARNFGTLGNTRRTLSRFWSSASTKDKPQSAGFYEGGSWGNSIKDAIRKLGPNSRMMTQPPSDLIKQCSGFASLNEADKHKVWIAFFDALSMAESGHNPKVRFVESFGVTSRGMLQISWASARGHGGTCAGATANNLHDPNFNLGCGVKIMENQLRRRGTLFPESYYYWSVLSPTKNPSGFRRFSARLNHLKSNPDRWPAGCHH